MNTNMTRFKSLRRCTFVDESSFSIGRVKTNDYHHWWFLPHDNLFKPVNGPREGLIATYESSVSFGHPKV